MCSILPGLIILTCYTVYLTTFVEFYYLSERRQVMDRREYFAAVVVTVGCGSIPLLLPVHDLLLYPLAYLFWLPLVGAPLVRLFIPALRKSVTASIYVVSLIAGDLASCYAVASCTVHNNQVPPAWRLAFVLFPLVGLLAFCCLASAACAYINWLSREGQESWLSPSSKCCCAEPEYESLPWHQRPPDSMRNCL
jgi:hypothetical protein